MQLAEQAQIDIIKSPNVTGDVTVKVTNIPLEEVLNNILAAHGYTYVPTENMIRVMPLSEVALAREKLVTRIYRIAYADVSEVSNALAKFISKEGEIAYNKGTSNIIVTDIESKVKSIDDFIKEIDRITPQVLIEVKIYDIIIKDRFDIGITWSAGRTTTWGTSSEESVPSLRTSEARPLSSGAHEPFGTGSFSGETDFAESAEGLLEIGIINPHISINAFLKMQKEDVSATLLANPRVLVLDNETANFKIVSEIPYLTLSETAGGTAMGSIEFREVGVELDVVPHVTRDEKIRIQVKPRFSVVSGEVIVGGFQTVSPQPIVDNRTADTTLLVDNGQTVVLGGLRKKDINAQINKIPFLGDLPLLGGLFRFEGEETINSEIVVFITPKVVQQPPLSKAEAEQLDLTEFEAPQPLKTRAERKEEK